MRFGVRFLQSTAGLVFAGVLLWSACTKIPTDGGYQPPNQNPNILNLSNATASAGDTGVVIDVNLHNVEPMAGAQLRIVYDSTRLKLSDTPYLKPSRADQMGNYILGSNPDPGEITFAMFPNIGQTGMIAAGDGPILQLLFDVKPTATSGNSQLGFESEGYSINALSDTLGVLIIPQLENGSFTVQ